jgi:transketolase
MRDGFKRALIEVASTDSRIQVLTGDHGYELFDDFRRRFPDRFHNVGVAEANMVGLAAGFARNGLRPLIYGLAAFVPNRVFEFIKLQIALDELPVVMVGDGAGLVYSQLGSSHQTLEDLAIMGSLPNVTTLSPGSDDEMRDSVVWAFQQASPVYIRMGKSGGAYSGSNHSRRPEPTLVSSSSGKASGAIIAHGSMMSQVLQVMDLVPGHSLDFWSCPTVFPVPASFVKILEADYSKLFVVEEHLVRGGLASELLIELRNTGLEVHPICASPQTSRLIGSYEWNLSRHGLSSEGIAEAIRLNL